MVSTSDKKYRFAVTCKVLTKQAGLYCGYICPTLFSNCTIVPTAKCVVSVRFFALYGNKVMPPPPPLFMVVGSKYSMGISWGNIGSTNFVCCSRYLESMFH